MTDDPIENEVENESGGGGILAIVVLAVAIVLVIFVFREEMGIGTPTTGIAVPREIPVDATPVAPAPNGNDVAPAAQ